MSKKYLLFMLFIVASCVGLPCILCYFIDLENDPLLFLKLFALCVIMLLTCRKSLKKIHPFYQIVFTETVLYALLFKYFLPSDLEVLCVSLGVMCVLLCNLDRWSIRILQSLIFAMLIVFLQWLGNYEEIFGTIGFDAYLAVLQTNFEEASDYIFVYSDWDSLVLACLFIFWMTICRDILFSHREPAARRQIIWVGFAIMLPGVYLAEEALAERGSVLVTSYSKYKAEMEHQASIRELLLNDSRDDHRFAQFDFEGDFIFILGESTTRRHMSLYGYPRKTTPQLSSLADQLLVHRDTVSPHSHTGRSVPVMFNFGIFDKAGADPDFSVDLLTALKWGGFEIWWLSNQSEFGLYDNLVTTLGKSADHYRFIRKGLGALQGNAYDHKLIPILEEALGREEDKRAIFLHLFATHTDYCGGIPPEYREILSPEDGLASKFFGGYEDQSNVVNCYDNAIRYIDHLISSVFELAFLRDKPTIVVYIPDHGENPIDKSFHNSARHSAYHVEIPHLWYFNSTAREALYEKEAYFRENAGAGFITRNLFHTVLDVLGAEDGVYDPRRSLFSSQYSPGTRLILCEDTGCTDYDDADLPGNKDSLEMTRAALWSLRLADGGKYQKVWAHRVNSLGKLLEAKEYFAGVEADLIFDQVTGRFHVLHPPAPDLGLDLQEYLKAMQDRPELQLWLDWKNADEKSFDVALKQLCELDRIYNLKHRIIIETGSNAVFEALSKLGALGFRHSYYVPVYAVRQCLAAGEQRECERLSERILGNIQRIGAGYVSYPIDNEPFFRQFAKRFESYGKLTWNLDVPVRGSEFGAKLVDIEKYEAYLVTFESLLNI